MHTASGPRLLAIVRRLLRAAAAGTAVLAIALLTLSHLAAGNARAQDGPPVRVSAEDLLVDAIAADTVRPGGMLLYTIL